MFRASLSPNFDGFGGLVVSMPAEAIGFFRYMKKILSMPSFGGEVKESPMSQLGGM
jgi:hypothetical protein